MPINTSRSFAFLLLLPILAGCDSDAAEEPQPHTSDTPAIGTAFDPANTGTIFGRVAWEGDTPHVAGFPRPVPQPDGRLVVRTAANPNRPHIDPESRGVAGVVVFLKGVEPKISRPWDLPPVSVEMGNDQITVIQGERQGRVGFVRRGDAFTASSIEDTYHALRGRGDAFFGLTLPKPNEPAKRILDTVGRVELTSAAGAYWMSADLFVVDHPYFTVTDANGHFTLNQVPAGNYELVAWHPGWETAKMERDPELTLVTRMRYSPPIKKSQPVGVTANEMSEASFTIP